MQKPSNILLVKNRALGDSIMGLSAVQYIRKLHPEVSIIYAVPQWVAPLYKEVTTAADSIYPLSLKTLKEIYCVYKDMKRMKIDHIHEMHQSGRGAKVFKLIALLLGIPYTAHNHHLKSGTKVIDQGEIKPLIQRDLDGVYSFLADGNIPNFLNYPPQLEIVNPTTKKNRIIFGVVATRQTKMWPLENYVLLAKLLKNDFPEFQISIPLSKSKDDQQIKYDLEKLGIPSNTEIVSMPLGKLPAYFNESAFYIGNDTGLKHIAVAVGLKSFTLFGPEPASEWHPYDKNIHPYFYLEGLPCRTRTHHYCGLAVCNLDKGFMDCLKFFTPELVLENLKTTCKDFLQSHDL